MTNITISSGFQIDNNTITLGTGNVMQTSAATTVAWNSIGGFIVSSIAGTNTTASFSLSAGSAADSTNVAYINKTTSTSWAASNGNAINGTDAASSTLANSTTYHIFMISGASGTGSFVSSSLTPTFPTGYTTYNRRVGSFRTSGAGAPLPYTAIEVEGGAMQCWLSTIVLDVNGGSVATGGTTLTLTSIPTGVKHRPIIVAGNNSAAGSTNAVRFYSLDGSSAAPSSAVNTVPLTDQYDATESSNWSTPKTLTRPHQLTTNTSAQIGGRCASNNVTVGIATEGWIDFRRA